MESIIAISAAVLTSIQLIPQTLEAIKDKDLSHISKATFQMTCVSAFLWILHGFNLSDYAIIFANIIIFCCALIILIMKEKKRKKVSKKVK
jgi:MtN3 and saliva related transmembrane protein